MSEPRTEGVPFSQALTPLRFSAILFILLVATFPQVLLFGQSFVFRDFGLFNYPLAFYAKDRIFHGEIPLWNPFNNCGIPFLAQWNSQVLYPLSVLYWLIPLPWSLSFFCIVHLFIAGLGMYFLATAWTKNRFAGAFAGVAFVFNGFMINSVMWPHYMATFAWMPWTILAVERGWLQTGIRSLLVGSLVAALQMLGGGPEIILLTWMFLSVLCAVKMWQSRSEAIRVGLKFVAMAAITTSLTAAQLAPFLDLLIHSQRTAGFDAGVWSMPYFSLANFILPLFHTSASSAGVHFLPEQAFTSSYYPGIAVIAFAILATWTVRNTRIKVLAIAIVSCMALCLGDKALVFTIVRKVIPVFGLIRYPIKFVILLTFLFPVLAAYYLAAQSTCVNNSVRRISQIGGGLIVLIITLVCVAYFYPYKDEVWQTTAINGAMRIFSLILISAVTYFVCSRNPGKMQLPLVIGSLVFVWIDGVTQGPSQNPVVNGGVYQPGLPPLHKLQPQPALGDSRAMVSPEARHELHEKILSDQWQGYLCNRLALFDNCNILDEIPKVDGIYSVYLRQESDVRYALYTHEPSAMAPPLDFMAVSQITAPGKIFDWSVRSNALPMITAGQKPLFVNASNSLDRFVSSDFDPRKTVLLWEQDQGEVRATNTSRVTITNEKWNHQSISFDTESTESALAVISQTYYHPWRATVDGLETKLLRANHAFQALEVPQGTHHVQLIYRDTMFFIGALVSLTSLSVCIGVLWLTRKKDHQANN